MATHYHYSITHGATNSKKYKRVFLYTGPLPESAKKQLLDTAFDRWNDGLMSDAQYAAVCDKIKGKEGKRPREDECEPECVLAHPKPKTKKQAKKKAKKPCAHCKSQDHTTSGSKACPCNGGCTEECLKTTSKKEKKTDSQAAKAKEKAAAKAAKAKEKAEKGPTKTEVAEEAKAAKANSTALRNEVLENHFMTAKHTTKDALRKFNRFTKGMARADLTDVVAYKAFLDQVVAKKMADEEAKASKPKKQKKQKVEYDLYLTPEEEMMVQIEVHKGYGIFFANSQRAPQDQDDFTDEEKAFFEMCKTILTFPDDRRILRTELAELHRLRDVADDSAMYPYYESLINEYEACFAGETCQRGEDGKWIFTDHFIQWEGERDQFDEEGSDYDDAAEDIGEEDDAADKEEEDRLLLERMFQEYKRETGQDASEVVEGERVTTKEFKTWMEKKANDKKSVEEEDEVEVHEEKKDEELQPPAL